MTVSVPGLNKYEVVCVCGGHGYPRGTATAARITMVGRALQRSGIPFRVLHCGPSPAPMNTERAGVYEGIRFQYTTTTHRPRGRLLQLCVYLWALFGVTWRLIGLSPRRQTTAIYLYLMEGPLTLYLGLLCRVLGLPLVQEMCEWWPGDPRCGWFDRWLYRGPIFRLASGVLVISKAIEGRVNERRETLKRGFPVHRVPALVDSEVFTGAAAPAEGGEDRVPEFVYCGTWKKDQFFLIRALRTVQQNGYRCRLRLVLGIAEHMAPAILQYAAEQGIDQGDLITVGCVDHSDLGRVYKGAVGLLMPLWDDDRSITRLPNKMSEYLASGRPVVTSSVGDLKDLLTDGVNAYIAEAGDERAFAERLMALLADPRRGDRIGLAGQAICSAKLDFGRHAGPLSEFFIRCIQGQRRSGMTGRLLENRPLRVVRNFICGSLAVGILLSGRVRRAKRKAFEDGVVTSIYFHKPNRRLFASCVRWLKKNGYQFINTDDLIDIVHRRRKAPVGAVWLSFDDGCKELMTDVLPVAHEEKVPVALFIPSGIIAGNGLFPWMHAVDVATGIPSAASGVRDAMTLPQLKVAAEYPEVTIGSHTVSHAITTQGETVDLRREFADSKRQLADWIGIPVRAFAYPGGFYDGREPELLAEYGYELAAITEPRFVTSSAEPFKIPRFHVGDNIPFPEAICNMVGVWRPTFDSLINPIRRGWVGFDARWRAARIQTARKRA